MKMKTVYKKLIALTIALVMMFVFIAACDNSETPPITTGPGPATTPAPTPTPVEDDDDDDDDSFHDDRFDFGGREFVIYTWMPGIETFDPDPALEDPEHEDIGAWDNLQRILEDFNGSVSYEVAAHEDIYALFVASMLAGSPPGDMVHIPQPSLISAVAGGFIMNMADVVPGGDPFWDPPGTWWSQPVAEVGSNFWGIGFTNTPYPWTMSYNKNILQAAGLDDPGLLYDRGGWTWDVFLNDYLRPLTTFGPDGVPNQWGLSGPPDSMLKLMMASNNGAMIDSSDFSIALDTEASLAAFDFFNQVVVQEQLTKPFVDWWTDFVAFGEGDVGFWVNEHWSIWVGGLHFDPDVAVGGVPFPRGPNNNSGYTHFLNINTGIAIPVGVDNPLQCYDMAFEMHTGWRVMSIEAMDSETGIATLEQFLVASSTYVTDTIYGDTEADGQRMLNDWFRNGKLDWGMAMGILGYDDVFRLAQGEVTTSQFIEELRPEINDLIEEFFGALRQ